MRRSWGLVVVIAACGRIRFDRTDYRVGVAFRPRCATGGVRLGLDSQVVTLTGVGPGFTKTGDDQMGDWSEYKITSDPAGTQESATFDNTAGANFAITAVAIKPAAP
jgi:hypothetical protein